VELEDLERALATFPRTKLCNLPSPVQSWMRLSQHWDLGSTLLAKRDDLIGPAFGGNKSRQLEFLLGEAIANGCDSVVHGGAIQSNYCRQLSAACASLGLECYVILSNDYDQQFNQGSHLIDRLMGAKITIFEGPLGIAHEKCKAELTHILTSEGRNPYLITYPKSEILGGLSYISAAIELVRQLPSSDFPQRIVMPAVGASYAGLLFGMDLLGVKNVEILGIAPLSEEYEIAKTIKSSIIEIATLLNLRYDEEIFQRIHISNDWVGDGYAKVTDSGISALIDVAQFEGVLLDPVYTAKAAAALRAMGRTDKRTLFWHTGGAPAIFAYADVILKYLKD
jgi:1-aminocyclopropane-1-carboxylate deaminase/D-cysteine desulfhydrase-like pyridoxal-dependent ACC family enzyme